MVRDLFPQGRQPGLTVTKRTGDDVDEDADEALVEKVRDAMQAAAQEPEPDGYLSVNSQDDPHVIFRTDHERAVRSEYAWIRANHGHGSSVRFQSLLTVGDRKLDLIAFETEAGEKRSVYFDITRAWEAMAREVERLEAEDGT